MIELAQVTFVLIANLAAFTGHSVETAIYALGFCVLVLAAVVRDHRG